jgi:hypothetical protein
MCLIGLKFASEQHSLGLMDGYLACSGSGAHLVKGWAIFLNRSIFLTPEVISHLSPYLSTDNKLKSANTD